MQIDIEDIMAGAVGRILVIFLFLLSAVWLGSIIGTTAWQVGDYGFESLPDFGDLLMSMVMQINLWIVPNAAFLAIMTVYLFVFDGTGHVAWGIIVGFESLFLMLGWCLHFEETNDTRSRGAAGWACWRWRRPASGCTVR
ncbi:MAG: hypothetical protein EOP87_15960 [Verrucomicrobiaceae bacterium]|nr:MAG: hypothetical protein EOP87_15960 [Verrucomicrobiaceae bacterium]